MATSPAFTNSSVIVPNCETRSQPSSSFKRRLIPTAPSYLLSLQTHCVARELLSPGVCPSSPLVCSQTASELHSQHFKISCLHPHPPP